MTPIAKILGGLAASILLFFIPVFIQEHRLFLDPFFSGAADAGAPMSFMEEKEIAETVRRFNFLIREIHAGGDTGQIVGLPATQEVKKNVLLEVEFLRERGLPSEAPLSRLDIGKVTWLDRDHVSLGTIEVWGKEKNHMVYTVEKITGTWTITGTSLDDAL